MDFVRARLHDHVDHAARRLAVLGRKGIRLDLELLNGVNRNRRGVRSPGVGGALQVVVVNAVQHYVVLAGPHAGGAEGVSPAGVRHHRPRGKQRELDVATAIERKVHDLLVADDLALRRLDRREQGRVGKDRDAFGDLADFERDVDDGRFADL